ncbi:MAG: hypothetical protein ABL983_06700 [Nitrospira sp.]
MGKVKVIYAYGDESAEEVTDRLQLLYDNGYHISHVVETTMGDEINTTYILEKF